MSTTPGPTVTQTVTKQVSTVPPHKQVHQIVFVAYPKLLFVWPLILAGLVFWPLASASDAIASPTVVVTAASSPAVVQHAVGYSERLEYLGWAYIAIMALVVMALGVDLNRNSAVFWIVAVAAVYFLGLWLRDAKGITVFGDIYRWFDSLDVQYSRSLGVTISILLLIPFIIMCAWAHINDRWRITHNEFEHYSFGKMDDSLGRGAKTIRSEYPDMFELLLGGAGTLIVYNASGDKELRRIPHVMFLPLIRKKLNRILEQVSVTSATGADEEEETHM